MATSHFSLKTTNYIRISNSLLIPSSWHSNTCHIYWQVVFLGWFLNTFEIFSPKRFNKWIPLIVSTLFSYYTGSHSTSNCTYPWSNLPFPSGGVCPIIMRETLYWLINHILCFQFHDTFATHFSLDQFRITIVEEFPIACNDIGFISTTIITPTTYLGSWALVALIIVAKFIWLIIVPSFLRL
jgi:hypothetical protein